MEEGIAQIQQGLAAWRATGAEALPPPITLPCSPKPPGREGKLKRACTFLAEALAVAKDTGECRWDAELHRLTGVLLLARLRGHHAEAETCFRQAFNIARQQQAKSLELRAGMSFGCRRCLQGKPHAEAREELPDVHLRLVHRGV